MKRLLFALSILCFMAMPALSLAQANSQSKPKYERFPEIPPFKFTSAGGDVFTNNDLEKGKPTMIFLFSVDCSHCQHMTRQITENIKKFKGTQIIMITPFKYKQMYAYYRGFGIQKYPDIITMGSDSTRALNMFYEQRYYPGIYIYNKKGSIIYHTEGDVGIKTILAYLKPE